MDTDGKVCTENMANIKTPQTHYSPRILTRQ